MALVVVFVRRKETSMSPAIPNILLPYLVFAPGAEMTHNTISPATMTSNVAHNHARRGVARVVVCVLFVAVASAVDVLGRDALEAFFVACAALV